MISLGSNPLGYAGGAQLSAFPYPTATDPVLCAPATAFSIPTGAANYGNAAGKTSAEFFQHTHRCRMRQTGKVVKLRFYVKDLTGLTGFYIKIFRYVSGNNYQFIQATPNLHAGAALSAGMNTVDLATPLEVEEGDYYCVRLEASGGFSAQNLTSRTGETSAFSRSITNEDSGSFAGQQYAWANKTAASGVVYPVEFSMAPPRLVGLGDSLTSGNGGDGTTAAFASMLEPSTTSNVLTNQWMRQISLLFGGPYRCPYQNMGLSGQRSDEIAARLQTDLLDLTPAVANLAMGTNDVVQGTSEATFLASYRDCIDGCLDTGILPVCNLIIPYSPDGSPTVIARQAYRRQLNASLLTLLQSYGSRVVIVDQAPYVGQPDNQELLQAALTPDGIHLLIAGKSRQARAVADSAQRDGYARTSH